MTKNPSPRARHGDAHSYPLAMNTIGAEEVAAAKAVLDSGQMTMGKLVQRFEEAFASYVGASHALMVNSGSSANLLMVDAMVRRSSGDNHLNTGDEVIVPALAWPTTVWPLAQLGLVPVFVDIDPDTLAIDLDSAAAALSPRTKGMLLVHVLGRAPEMANYQAFCSTHDLALLEDSCETVGAYSNEQHTGTFGEMGSFSCYFSHHLSTIEGGIVVTSDDAVFDDLKSLRSHGWARDRSDRSEWHAANPEIDDRFLFVMGGYNVRPTEIQAAIGLVQITRLDAAIESREQLAAHVTELLDRHAPWLELIGASELLRDGAESKRTHTWMTLPLRLRHDAPTAALRAE